MAPNIVDGGGNFVLVYHSCEPVGTSVLTRFKSDFYQVPNDPHPDNPRARVRIPKLGTQLDSGWRCGARVCEKCAKTAGTLTSLTLPVAISHGITGVPVQEPSGQVLGLLAVQGLRHRHRTTFAAPSQAAGWVKGAPLSAPQRSYTPYQASTDHRSDVGPLSRSSDRPQQGSTRSLPVDEEVPAAKMRKGAGSTKKGAFAEDVEDSFLVSGDEDDYPVIKKRKSVLKRKRSSHSAAIDRDDGGAPVGRSDRPKRKAKEAASASLWQSSHQDEGYAQVQENDGEHLMELVMKKESRAERKERHQRELDMVNMWEIEQ